MPLVRHHDAGGKTLLVTEYGNQGYFGPPDFPQERMENLHNIDIRDDDVLLLSYTKSGCHWLWELTRMLRAGTCDMDLTEKEKYMMEFGPDNDLSDRPSPRTLNTHFRFHQLPQKVQDGKVKLLFIYRNPKDVAVSLYHHHCKFPEYEYQGQFRDHLTGLFMTNNVDFGGFFEYLRDYEAVFKSRPDLKVFFLSYEELHADTLGKTRQLAKFLDAPASEDTIRAIVDKCSFTSMQDRKGKQWIEQYGTTIMYRKGKVGDWKNWFTVADSEKMDELCEKEMKGSTLYKFQYTL